MIAHVVGKKIVEFTSKTDGRQISYAELYCLVDDKHVTGKKVLTARTSKEKVEGLTVPADYHLDYQPRNDGTAQLVGIYKLEK